MQINTIPEDFIINMSKEGQGNFESNFLLHGLIIKNDTDKPITLKHIDMELYANKNSVKQLTYRDQALVQILSHFVNECTWLGKGFGAQLFLGEEGFFNPEMFSQSLTLLPNQETGIFNEYFIRIGNFFYIRGKKSASVFIFFSADRESYCFHDLLFSCKNASNPPP